MPSVALGFCRKVRFLGQNPKIGYQKFNDLQTAKLSKKQLCDRTVEGLSTEAREALPRLFQALVHVDAITGIATRLRTNRNEIATDPAVTELLEALINARLLQAS